MTIFVNNVSNFDGEVDQNAYYSVWDFGGRHAAFYQEGYNITGTSGHDELGGSSTIGPIPGNPTPNYFTWVGNDTINGLDGNDEIDGRSGADSILGGAGDDDLYGGNGNDSLHGGDGADYVQGDADQDFLQGNAGNDSVYGGNGHDTLLGGQGDDVLTGNAGNDYFSGDLGNEIITGGSGADTFYHSGAAGSVINHDYINDFNQSEGDHIQVGNASYSVFQSGANTVIDFGNSSAIFLVNVNLSTLTAGWIST